MVIRNWTKENLNIVWVLNYNNNNNNNNDDDDDDFLGCISWKIPTICGEIDSSKIL